MSSYIEPVRKIERHPDSVPGVRLQRGVCLCRVKHVGLRVQFTSQGCELRVCDLTVGRRFGKL